MHKLGLKIWSTNRPYIKPAIDLYEKKVFDYLELFVVPGSAKEYLNLWKEVQLPIILHAPHSDIGFNFSLKEFESRNRESIQEVDIFRKALNPLKIIFHSGTNGSLEETIRQIQMFKNEFVDLFKIVVIENKPKVGILGENCMGASPQEIKKILEETRLGFCLDMGHAICYAAWQGVDYKGVIEQFMKLNPQMYHLSDGDIQSKTDMHLNFGTGNFNLAELISRMPLDAYVSIETNKRSQSDLEDFKEDIIYFRKHSQVLNLREVEDDDCKDIYDWRNHPIVRKNSFHADFFSFDDHQIWFQRKRQSLQTTMYVAYYKGDKAGMIRFEEEKDDIKVSVMLNPKYIGQGLGTLLIDLGVKRFKGQKKVTKFIIAEIKPDNVASIKAFEKAGFRKNETAYILR